MVQYFAIDTETTLMGPGAVCPKLICLTIAGADETHSEVQTALYGNDTEGRLHTYRLLLDLLGDDDVVLVFHNAAFDLTVLAQAFPDLIPAIFTKLYRGLVTDTKIREKLLNLSTHGDLEFVHAPDGSKEPVSYSLATLVLNYLGVDRTAEKSGDADTWRMNFEQFDGVPASEYAQGAVAYACQDASDTLEVFHAQAERVRGAHGPSSVATESFQTAVDFALRLMTCWGMKVDQEARQEVADACAAELVPEKLDLLIASGILTPARGPEPYANGAKDKNGQPKMKKAQPEKVSKKKLQAHVESVCAKHGIEPKRTAPSERSPEGQISTDREVLDLLKPLDQVIAQYHHRQTVYKLVTSYLPALEGVDTVHPEFDVLKETGRTSSYGGRLYPSVNIQQVDPRVRKCYVARPGRVLCSVDYQAIELAALGQRCYELFGYSVHRDRINEGADLHAYLGSQLALRMDPEFAQTVKDLRGAGEVEDDIGVYELFLSLKHSDPAYFKHWRKFAKPTGLGLPGGMGVATFRTMARVSYGVDVDEATAELMKQVWHETYPETVEYFQYVKANLQDAANSRFDQETGERDTRYAYSSPLGMYRAGASYCAAANGFGLQTATAEGAKSAVFEVARACYDASQRSILFGARPVAFIHDELIVELPDDDVALRHAQAQEIADLMVASMSRILPDVTIRAEPALMYRWDKRAETVLDTDGRLAVWTPPEDTSDDPSLQEAPSIEDVA